MDKAKIHAEICDKLNQIYRAKNHDYGDSFAIVRDTGYFNKAVKYYSNKYDGEKRIKAFFEKFQNATEYKLKEQGIDVRGWCNDETI